jgi:hypothetical protein
MFPDFTEIWLNGLVKLDLTKRWKEFGLNVTGVDYFTLGAVVNGVSTRFDPQAKQYQSWLGGYLVEFANSTDRRLQDFLDLAVVDQIDWLKHYGDPNPACTLSARNFRKMGDVNVGGYHGRVYEGGGVTHSDVGINASGPWLLLVTIFMATIFDLSNARLRSTYTDFLPVTVQSSYSTVYLRGYVIVIRLEKDIYAVLYGNGAIFKDRLGTKRDTFENLGREILASLMAVKIFKLRGSHRNRRSR